MYEELILRSITLNLYGIMGTFELYYIMDEEVSSAAHVKISTIE